MKKQIPAWAALLIITLFAGLALGGTYALTEDAIAQQAVLTAENARKNALPEADAFEAMEVAQDAAVDWCYTGTANGKKIGFVCQATVQGFGGSIEVIVGMDTNQRITGVTVGGSAFSETAGLGAKAKESSFTSQFIGKQAPLTVAKAGDAKNAQTVDAITSATITSRAATNAVNLLAEYMSAQIAPEREGGI